jgi:putative oxidoreductase
MQDLFLIGRMIFGSFFLYNGVNHFLNVTPMAEYAAAKGVPMPEIAVVLSGALLVFGGLSVIIGFLPRVGLACLAVFLVSVSPVMHNFWDVSEPGQRMNEMGHFLKNMAMLGASLMMLAMPVPWSYSLEERRRIAA